MFQGTSSVAFATEERAVVLDPYAEHSDRAKATEGVLWDSRSRITVEIVGPSTFRREGTPEGRGLQQQGWPSRCRSKPLKKIQYQKDTIQWVGHKFYSGVETVLQTAPLQRYLILRNLHPSGVPSLNREL